MPTTGAERYQYLSLPAQAVHLKKQLIPGEIGQVLRQLIHAATVQPCHFPQDALGRR